MLPVGTGGKHYPAYLRLSDKELALRVDELYSIIDGCRLCPRRCGAKRLSGERGICGAKGELRVASVNLHTGEEPPISGHKGSGTVFFSGCSLKCKFCQNYPISRFFAGNVISVEELAHSFNVLQRKGAHNVNLVTASHFIPFVVEAIFIARKGGFSIPVVFNSSGYEDVELIRFLDNIIDIYLPDIKYSDEITALKYSGVKDYVRINRIALRAMFNQAGGLILDENGLALSGMMIRHLVLPDNLSGWKDSFKFIKDEFGEAVPVSLMSQYFPAYKGKYDGSVNRKITRREYAEAVIYMKREGLNGYYQDDTLDAKQVI